MGVGEEAGRKIGVNYFGRRSQQAGGEALLRGRGGACCCVLQRSSRFLNFIKTVIK
jgi:hypothetical protein